MRKPVSVTQHGNSCRFTFPPPMLRYLGWVNGTELMITVKDKHHVEIVDFDTYVTEQSQRQRREQQAPVDEAPR